METETHETHSMEGEGLRESDMTKEKPTKLNRKEEIERKSDLDDSDVSSNDDNDETRPRTRSRTGKSKNVERNRLAKSGVAKSRVRTRSQCSGEDELHNTEEIIKSSDKKSRTQRKGHSEEDKSDLDIGSGKTVVPTRMRTRSMGDTENEIEKKNKAKSKKVSPVTRVSVKSSQIDSSEEEEIDNDGDDDNDDIDDDDISENNESDDDLENEKEENVPEQEKRLSAIYEENDNMEVDIEIDDERKNVEKEIVCNNSKKMSKENHTGKEHKSKDVEKKKKKAASSSLLVQLELFAKFKDPKSMYMEPQLRQLYFDVSIKL